MAIGRELDERGITTPAAIGEAFGMPAAEATKLMTGRQWREGDVALLQAAAARLGVQVPKAAWVILLATAALILSLLLGRMLARIPGLSGLPPLPQFLAAR
jgi:hypothetical protein